LLPVIAFPAGFLTTAAVFQSLYEDASSGLAYAKSLVFEFPLMFFSLAISYAILRAIAAWYSLRPSVWLSFVSSAFAFILFPSYFAPIAALIEPLESDHLGMVMMGVTPACVGLAVESLGSLVLKIVRRLTPYRIKVAEQNRDRDPDYSEAPPTPPGMRVRTGRFISSQ